MAGLRLLPLKLATRLYTHSERWGLRLVATVAIAAILDALLRGMFTDRGYLSVFTIVLFLFNCLTTFGWRLIWLSVALGLAAKSVETASNTPMFLILLPFLGSGFVPTH